MNTPWTRRPDWQPRLTAYVQSVVATPFEWGRHDCATFAAGGVEAVTGIDPAEGLRDRYSDLRSGLRLLHDYGVRSPVELVEQTQPTIAPASARPGDIAAIETPEGVALGIVQGSQIYVVGPDGLRLVSLMSAQRVWGIG